MEAGPDLAEEIANPSGTVLRRYVPGPGVDEPVVWYEGAGTSDRRFLQADERGSVVAVSDASGAKLAIDTYDEYGVPGAGNAGRFQYTGQAWYGEIGLYNFKARMYSHTLGRFLQTDPIGYGDGMNWYNYAHADPVNHFDPTGTDTIDGATKKAMQEVNDHLLQKFVDSLDSLKEIVVTCCRSNTDFSIINSPVFISPPTRGFSFLTATLTSIPIISPPKKATPTQNLLQRVTSFLCSAPSVAGGGGLDAYAGVGGSVSGAVSFNPRNGQISIGFDTGVGVGIGGGGRIAGGRFAGIGNGSSESLPIAGGGVNVNGTAVAGPAGITGSYQLLGSNKGDFGLAATGGAELSANVNVSAHGQFNLPSLYSLGCK